MAAAAAAPPVSPGRRPIALLRVPMRFCPLAARVMAPSPRREGALKISQLQLRATPSSEDSSSTEDDDLPTGFREKRDAIENKSLVCLYGGGAIIAVWLSSVAVRAIDSVPLLPNLLDLVGLGCSGWFVYQYLLFKAAVGTVEDAQLGINEFPCLTCLADEQLENRQEFASEIDSLKKRINGNED